MIYAIDFDGTLCVSEYPAIGLGIYHAIKCVRNLKWWGHTIIINTCRMGKEAEEAKAWLRWWRVPYDYFNENDPKRVALYGGDSRKISADRYIDDRGFVGAIPWGEIMREAREKVMEEREGCSTCSQNTTCALRGYGALAYAPEECPVKNYTKAWFKITCSVPETDKPASATAIPGVGPDAPTAVNASGGKQSATPYRMDLLDPGAMLEQGEILGKGAAKYGEYNWKKLSIDELLNHAEVHILAWRAGDRTDNHLGHAACRLLMARTLEMEEEKAG